MTYCDWRPDKTAYLSSSLFAYAGDQKINLIQHTLCNDLQWYHLFHPLKSLRARGKLFLLMITTMNDSWQYPQCTFFKCLFQSFVECRDNDISKSNLSPLSHLSHISISSTLATRSLLSRLSLLSLSVSDDVKLFAFWHFSLVLLILDVSWKNGCDLSSVSFSCPVSFCVGFG